MKFQFATAIRRLLPKKHIRNYSSSNKKDKNKCCKIEPCPKCPDPPDPPGPNIVQEKKCVMCSFTNWKPKPKTCYKAELDKRKYEQFRQDRCWPGMGPVKKVPDPLITPGQVDPFKGNLCLKPHRRLVRREAVAPVASKNLPRSDWDSDC